MANPAPSTAPRGWRNGAVSKSQKGPSKSSSRGLLAALILAIVAGLGAIAGTVWYYWPAPPAGFVALWVANYADRRIPSDPTSAPDYRALARTVALPDEEPGRATGLSGNWRERLANLPDSAGAVLYVSAHAYAEPGGEIHLLPSDTRPGQFGSEPTLRDVLEALKASPARNTLLILDIMRPLADPRLGVLADDVPAQIRATLAAAPDERRMVLSACGPGQVSLASEALGRSVFNYYVDRGLRGAADQASPAPDGAVTARELVTYVRDRVAAWAAHSRGAVQVPVVEALAADFMLVHSNADALEPDQTLPAEAIVALPPPPEKPAPPAKGRETPEPAPPDAKPAPNAPPTIHYPDWLLAHWKTRAAWWELGTYRVAPHPFRRLEAALLDAERAWRMGTPAEVIQARLRPMLPPDQQQLETALKPPRPDPLYSLALASSLGRTPDPALTEAVRAWLVQLKNPPPGAAPAAPPDPSAEAAKFLAAQAEAIDRDPTGYSLACAVEEVASLPGGSNMPPFIDRLPLLAQLALLHQPEPLTDRFVEMLLLKDLATLAGALPSGTPADDPATPPAPAWSPATLVRAWEVLRGAEEADSSPESFPWLAEALDRASLQRHVVEILLRSPGYVPEAELTAALDQADQQYGEIRRAQRAILDTRRTLDEALAILPWYPAYLEAAPRSDDLARTWRDAVAEAQDLCQRLAPRQGDELARLVEELQRHGATLTEKLAELRQPFEPAAVAALLKRAEAQADAQVYRDLDAALRTPLLAPEDRARLWAAGRGLARRLHEGTPHEASMDLPRADHNQRPDPRLADRAERSLRLLELAGIDVSPLTSAQETYSAEPSPAHRAALAHAFRDAWTDQLPMALGSARTLGEADRLSRIFPPFERSGQLEQTGTNPSAALRAQDARDLWAWLAQRYTYEGQVIAPLVAGGTRLYGQGADAFERVVGNPPSEAALRLEVPLGARPPVLTNASPTGRATLRLKLENTLTEAGAEAGTQVELRALSPDPRLRVSLPQDRWPLKPGAEETVNLDLRFEESGDTTNPERRTSARIDGILVLATLGHRVYPRPLSIEGTLGTSPVRLILSDNPESPAEQRDALVRPVQKDQLYYLFVRNPSDQAREVTIRILANGAAVPGGQATLKLEPGQTHRVDSFSGPEAPAGAAAAAAPPPEETPAAPEMIPLTEPYRLEVQLEYDGQPAQTQTVPIKLALPTEYLTNIDPQFIPTGAAPDGVNRLSVRVQARESMVATPCTIELIVPRAQIPRLLDDPKVAETQAVLSRRGDVVRVSVADLRLSPVGEALGVFYLNVDDFERALKFGVRFGQGVNSEIPQRDLTPTIRRLMLDGAPLLDGQPRPVHSGKPLRIVVEVDNAPDGATLEASLTPQGSGAAFARKVGPLPAKRKSVTFAARPDGSLAFQAAIDDPELDFEVTGLRDRRQLVVQLLDAQDNLLGAAETRELLFDDRPPQDIEFVEVPRIIPFGTKTITVHAEATADSKIQSATFFLGRPVEGKRPESATGIPAKPVDADRTRWEAQVPLQGTELNEQALSVEFVNGVGLAATATQTIGIEPPPPEPEPEVAKQKDAAPAGPTTGEIAGTLLEGGRPQPNLTVFLYSSDDKGAFVAEGVKQAKTDTSGQFAFKDLPPGKYQLYAVKTASGRKATEVVPVEAGQTAKVTLNLSL